MKNIYHRQETSKDNGGLLYFYPQTSTGSALPGTATAILYNSSGVSQGSTALVWEDKKITITVPALSYGDNYYAEVSYVASGSSQTKLQRIPFDVVHSVWGGQVLCSYDDLAQQHTDIPSVIARLAASESITPEEKAFDFINQAHTEIDGWIRSRSLQDGSVRSRSIFDRDLLNYCEARLAASKVFQAITPGVEDHPTENKRRMFYSDAKTYFQSLQFLYDRTEDGKPDTELSQVGTTFIIRRR